MNDCEKLEFGCWFDGRSHPIWHYRSVPPGMTPATIADLWHGRQVLAEVMTGPDKGEYYATWVRESSYAILCEQIRQGYGVYVKK